MIWKKYVIETTTKDYELVSAILMEHQITDIQIENNVQLTDDTGVETTLSSSDADEATALGLSAGDFVLYIKAEEPEYLTGEKHFTLWADGYARTTFTMLITEPED